MAYMLTAVMTGGVAALISLFTGSGFLQMVWNYLMFGHLGIATLALAVVASSMIDRKSETEAEA